MSKTLTTGEIAKYCNVNFRTVIRWIERGLLNAYKLPGRGDNRVPLDSFLQFLEENNMPVPQELKPRNNRILIVDDDRSMAKAIARALKNAGYIIEIATNGFSAGTKIHQFKPCLITLDLKMPGLSGFEVLDYIQNESSYAALKVLVISGEGEDELEKALQKGAHAAMAKPFENQALLANIETLLTD